MNGFVTFILILGMIFSAGNIGIIVSNVSAGKKFLNKWLILHSFGTSIFYIIILCFLAGFSDKFPIILTSLVYILFFIFCKEKDAMNTSNFLD